MKILFNTYFYAFQNPGGGEVVLLKTREALLEKGIQVDLFDPWTTKIDQYDIVHDFSSLGWRNWQTLKSFGPKLVVTPVLWPNTKWPAPQLEKLKYKLRRLSGLNSPEVSVCEAMKIPDLIFPTTFMEQEKIQKRYGLQDLKRFKVIHNGINLPTKADGENSFCKEYKINDYLLFVGRISPLKNVKMIAEAAKATGKTLVIIGKADVHDKAYAEEIMSQASEQLRFIPYLPNDSQILQDAYRGAKAVVVASFFETCSLVGMEAGAFGRPVIMTEAGATKEIYKDLVTYINPHDIQSLIAAIHKVTETPSNERLQKHILENFSWDIIADHVVEGYKSLL